MKMFGGRGMGGGSGGAGRVGGGMLRSLRSVGRAVSRSRARLGVPATAPRDPLSSSSISSAFTAHKHVSSSSYPLSLSSTLFLYTKKPPFYSDDSEWVCVDGVEHDGGYVLGPLPSEKEVDDAVCALQQVFGPSSRDQVSSDGSETDWAEPSLSSYNSTVLQANGFDRVYYAFHLLKTDPYVQRMVKSLSADKVVWDAVLKNEVVRELREAIAADEQHVPGGPDETSDNDSFTTTNVVMRIFDTAKAIFMEVIEKITKIVNELFQPTGHRTHGDSERLDTFNDKLRTSFVLSIMVLMFVLLNRAQART